MSLPYHSLTTDQQARAAYLFADEVFGTDPSAYAYEVDKSGRITGRKPNQLTVTTANRARQSAPVTVTTTEEATLTDDLIHHARMSMDALAASIAADLNQTRKLQEVNS